MTAPDKWWENVAVNVAAEMGRGTLIYDVAGSRSWTVDRLAGVLGRYGYDLLAERVWVLSR